MVKLQRIEPEETASVESLPYRELPDYSREVPLSDGTIAVFRDLTGEDLEVIEKLEGGNIQKTMRLAERLCIKWGDKPGVTLPQLRKARAKDIMAISKTIESFLSSED